MTFRCPLCGGNAAERISDNLRSPMGDRFAMRPHRCRECSLVVLHPYMTEAELSDFYTAEFRKLYHGERYDRAAFHAARRPEASVRRHRLVEQGLLHGSVLEMGASTGAFLEVAAEQSGVSRVLGVEPDEQQRRFAAERGVEMIGTLDDLAAGGFDLIVLFHVLEHLLDPVRTLSALAARLAPGGSIVCEVPNVEDALLARYAIPEFEAFYWHPAHHLYFSRRTLQRAGRAAGLDAAVHPVQRYPIENHLHWAARRRPGGGRDWLPDLISPSTREAYAADLCRTFACDTLWMVGKARS